VVFITVQNLVGIDAVVLIICIFFDFTMQFGWKMPIHYRLLKSGNKTANIYVKKTAVCTHC